MNTRERITAVVLGTAGVLLIGVFFWMSEQSRVTDLVRIGISAEAAIDQAKAWYAESGMEQQDLEHRLKIRIDEKLLSFAQGYLPESADESLSAGSWLISYGGDEVVINDDEEQEGFEVEINFKGRLVGLECVLKDVASPEKPTEESALAVASNFLLRLGIDTALASLNEKSIKEEKDRARYTFRFRMPNPVSEHLTDLLDVDVEGSRVMKFHRGIDIAKESGFKGDESVAEIVIHVVAAVIWVVLGIFMIVVFVKRLRHDELEFRRGIWIGITFFVVGAAMVGIGGWPAWQAVVFGGLFTGLFIGLGSFVVYPPTESLNREVWKDRLALSDTLFSGKVGVRELGKCILISFGFIGATLVIAAGTRLLAPDFGFGYVKPDHSALWFAESAWEGLADAFSTLIRVYFVVIIFFSFWTTHLRSRIRKTWILFLFLIPFIHFSGLYASFIDPAPVGLVVGLPIAVLLTFLAIRFDLFTIFFTLLGVYLLDGLALMGATPEGLFGPAGLVTALVVLVIFCFAVVLLFRKQSIEDLGGYVPEYVSRIAERERFLKELEIARNVQMKFLPESVPSVPHLDIAAMCKPAMEVGGDYYDLIRMDDRHLAIVIGDVSGKGVSAAFYMTMAKGIIKTLVKRAVKPQELMTELNEIFCENSPRNVFISLIFGLFDLEKNTLTFSRAGHNPLIVRKRVKEEPELLLPDGLAIGLQRGPVFSKLIEEKTVTIEQGDTFVFYTDGVSESMNRLEEEFGEERLRGLIEENMGLSAQALMDKINDEINRFTGKTPQHDDFTLVVVRIN